MNHIRQEHTSRHVHLDLGRERRVLSSCVLRGGLAMARRLVILRVDGGRNDGTRHGDPSHALAAYCRDQGWTGPCTGFMTAASMDSLRTARHRADGIEVLALVTAGLSNALCAGDPAGPDPDRPDPDRPDPDRPDPDRPDPDRPGHPAPGTINIILACNARLAPAAMVDAVITATEAKTVVLRERGVASPVSGRTATGTGTDAVAVVAGDGPALRYCGKHTRAGELLALAVMDALGRSLAWYD